ncbi:MAG TPA: GntG family PLP-dependent aldolase [Longimicrobiales bacterium]|nr:GntG family PLP-dependent aldolase [Longimicrobiales bacterium]
MSPLDLRSDTVTRPTAGMRDAIARAEVGDDALGDDPTVRALEARVAELLGKDAALLFPSGIMANLTAMLAHTEPGSEAVAERSAHVVDWEDCGAAHFGGVQLRTVQGDGGLLDPDAVRAAIRPAGPHHPRTRLLCVENTHNAAGGRILPLERLRALRAVAAEHEVAVHLDGARLWNAAAATGVPLTDWGSEADTVMVTLSKGLGCPVGSMLAVPAALEARARRLRRRLGGGMRQSGVLAAAGLYALEHHRERLTEDHARARALADACEGLPGVRVVPPETNIVMLELADAPAVAAALRERGVLTSVFTPTRLRAVTHLDVGDDGVARAARALAEVLGG